MATVKDNPSESRGGPDPAHAQAAIASARQLLSAGDPDGAAAALRGIATRNDAPPSQLAEAAKIFADAGSPVDAVSRYLEAGRGFLDVADSSAARQNFASAYEIDGKNMDALFELGRVDVADGKKHDGLDKFVEVLRKSNLKHLPALYEAGCLYEQDGQHNQAILAFKRVVDREKTHVSALEHLGTLHQARSQLPDAGTYFTRAAEAAQAQFHHADAKRLAEMALGIDSGNAVARRVLNDVEKSLANPQPAEAPPTAPAATAAPAPVPPAPAPAHPQIATPVADVTPVTPPSADSPVPPPPPSTLGIALPPDVALLEQQSQAMAALAQVQNAVAQTYKQRIALEDEIRKAKAALDALQVQQQSVEDELSGRRDELAKVVSQRESEEASLAALGDALAKSKAELGALSALPAFIAEAQAKCAAAADAASGATNGANAAIAQSGEVKTKAAAIEASAKELQTKIAAVRQSIEAAEKQIAEIAGSAKAAQAASNGAEGQVNQVKAALDALSAKRASVESAVAELAAVAKQVEGKRAEADTSIKRLEALQAQRKSQFEEIIFKLPPLEQGAKPAAAPPQAQPQAPRPAAAPSAPAPAPAPAAKAPASAPSSGVASVDSLIASGNFAEAAARAQTEANAKPKPAEYLVDVGSKLKDAGKLDEAARLFAAARDRDQKNSRARFELGSACTELGRNDEAVAVLQTLENDPQFAVLGLVGLGKALRRRGDLSGAESRFAKALETEGFPEQQYHDALYQLAELHESKGDPESLGLALWSYEELQSGNPDYADVAERVANVKARLAEAGVRTEPGRNGAVKQ